MAELVNTLIEDPRWQQVGLEKLAAKACAATLAHLGLDPEGNWEINLLGCNDARIAELNADFRGKPQPTNVLSWPSEDLGAATAGGVPALPVSNPASMPKDLGDIAISYDTCAREATAAGRPMAAHVTHLVVHGTLHLLGYDHIDDKDAAMMEALEVEILGKLGLPDPYSEPGA